MKKKQVARQVLPTKAPPQGLTHDQARTLLAEHGPNELPRAGSRSFIRIIIDVLREPMLAMLIAGGLIYLALGDTGEAVILLVFALMSVLITVVQEQRTERVLEALRDMTSPRALVMRNGEEIRIAGREVVPGDILLLAEGDRVAADGVLLKASEIQADESLLTGESLPVEKLAGETEAPENTVYAGSLVVKGTATARVTRTGPLSAIGKIGSSLSTIESQSPRLQKETGKIVAVFATLGILFALGVVALRGMMTGDWLEAALSGIALGMAMMPEEFPVVMTVFMAMGAWRISKARVLTRRASAIESLGAATILCTDKTGTLTENRMTVMTLVLPDGTERDAGKDGLPKDLQFAKLAALGADASNAESHDPMDKAFLVLGRRADPGGRDHQQLASHGVSAHRLAVIQYWKLSDGTMVAAAKGAPETIARMCRLSKTQTTAMARIVEGMADKGLRVLAIASTPLKTGKEDPDKLHFALHGLAGLADPVRASVPQAVAECRAAGIRVIMITGDHPKTAQAIAAQAGIDATMVTTGTEMAALDHDALLKRLQDCSVFARILPDQKLRLVERLQAEGEVVAMTGDGVNDAPSLKAAHIGVAMGGRGTDVAREASSIVLLDDDFSSIVKAVRLGRRIYDNLKKAISFIFAVHVPIAGMALAPMIFGLPPVFGPVHIAFMEMVIDPVCSLVFEAEGDEHSIMQRPPRKPDEPLFAKPLVIWSVMQGIVAFALVFGVQYYAAVWQAMPVDEVRALDILHHGFRDSGSYFC